MADQKGETSNQLFSVLEEWEKNLKGCFKENSASALRPLRSFDTALRTALDFISNPHKIWRSGRLADRRAVLKLAFPSGFQYHRNSGLRTDETPLPFKALGLFKNKDSQMAGGTGTISNHKERDLAEPSANNKASTSELSSAFSAETCRELFDTLAQWNSYLEDHAPYFQSVQEPSL